MFIKSSSFTKPFFFTFATHISHKVKHKYNRDIDSVNQLESQKCIVLVDNLEGILP